MINNEQKGQPISLSCGIFLSKASTGYFELFMNFCMVVTEPSLLSCKLFWFLLQHASPSIARLFTFATAYLILGGSSYLWTQRSGHREMKGYCLSLIFHKRENCIVPLRTWNFSSCLWKYFCKETFTETFIQSFFFFLFHFVVSFIIIC